MRSCKACAEACEVERELVTRGGEGTEGKAYGSKREQCRNEVYSMVRVR